MWDNKKIQTLLGYAILFFCIAILMYVVISNRVHNTKHMTQHVHIAQNDDALKPNVYMHQKNKKVSWQDPLPVKRVNLDKVTYTHNLYHIQLATFYKKEHAWRLQKKLRKLGYTVQVKSSRNKKLGSIYRVRIGPYKDKKIAERIKHKCQKQLKLNGLILKT